MAKESYGQRGQQRGVPKAQQARNNPKPNDPNGPQSPGASAPDLSYLSEKQQAAVTKVLGNAYDPTKPLNVQLFKARWEQASHEERRAMMKNLGGQYLEGGPSIKTTGAFHMEYLDALNYENNLKAQQLQQRITDYSQNFGGYATTAEAAAATDAYWTNFANTPEGQAHIAQSNYAGDTAGWIASQLASSAEGVANYEKQSKYWSGVQQTAAALGQEVPGFKPPGWASTLEAIQQGRSSVPQPGGATYNMYPGVAADLAGIPPITTDQVLRNQDIHDQQGGAPATSGIYQPFTNFTGVQQPNSFSERDLYQETQAR